MKLKYGLNEPLRQRSHLRSLTRTIVVLFTLFGCIGCDQASKSMARTYLSTGDSESLFHDALRLELTDNPGAFLSLGASLSQDLRFVLFTAAVAALLTGLLLVALFAKRLHPWRVVGLALIAGGGTSNLLDRIMDGGRVTDFLNVGIGSLRTGIFNFADMAILAGAILVMVSYRAAHAGLKPPNAEF
jgi:signal peptidase II